MKHIPFTVPHLNEDDISAVTEVLRSGWITSGKIGEQFSLQLSRYLSAHHVCLLNSATAGLFLALKSMGIGEGDEVILPSYTFAATANVVYHTGAKIIFADVKCNSFYVDLQDVYQKITSKTKAIIFVDFSTAGSWDIDHKILGQKFQANNEFQEILKRPLILVDSAHALGSRFVNKNIDMCVYSFHAVKNLTTAEGGALALRSLGDEKLDQKRQAIISQYALHGQDKSAHDKFVVGSWEYDITVPGYKFNMPDTLAALGFSQLKRYESQILPQRRNITNHYLSFLKQIPRVLFSDVFDNVEKSSCHLLPIRIDGYTEQQRNTLIDYMKSQGIMTNVHYKPLHKMTVNNYYGWTNPLPNTDLQYQNEITLPLYEQLQFEDVEYIITKLSQGLSL